MRSLSFLSPTSVALFHQNQEEFYLRYLAEKRPPRIPQTKPMAVGAAFDAYIKSYLHVSLFGQDADPQFEFEALFEKQVESQNRDWASKAGQHAFLAYQNSGALYDILGDLQTAQASPRFEFEVRGDINGIPFLGKPDVYFTNKHGLSILLDWKVNGFCSNSALSPYRGYTMIRGDSKRGTHHKDTCLCNFKGLMINIAETFDKLNAEWAQQLSIYGWLCGESIGSDFVVAVDQLVCKPDKPDQPSIRIAEFRSRISEEFQAEVFNKAAHVWEVLNSEHFFRDLTVESSKQRCAVLDEKYKAYDDDNNGLFMEMTRC